MKRSKGGVAVAEVVSTIPLSNHEEELFRRFDVPKIEIEKRITKGLSGANVYLVLIFNEKTIDLAIAKFQKVSERNVNELELHQKVLKIVQGHNLEQYVPKIKTCAEYENWYGVLYELVGDCVVESKTLNYAIYNELPNISDISKNISSILYNWNLPYQSKDIHPIDIVEHSLGSRFFDERMMKAFEKIGVNNDDLWLTFDGIYEVFPNPMKFLQDRSLWGMEIPCLLGHSHGDLHGNNIMVSKNGDISIIDFGSFKDTDNIFYDHRYLELHVTLSYMSIEDDDQRLFWKDLCATLSSKMNNTIEIPSGPGSMVLRSVLPQLRTSIKDRITHQAAKQLYEPSFYLAGVAAGLNLFRKTREDDVRFAAFLYTVYNLQATIKHPTLIISNQKSLPWVKGDEDAIKVKSLKCLLPL